MEFKLFEGYIKVPKLTSSHNTSDDKCKVIVFGGQRKLMSTSSLYLL